MTGPDALPAAAPPRVRDRLARAADGPVRVVHRGRHAVYLDVGGWCVGVVGPAAVRVPCTLLVTDLPRVGSAAVRRGVLHLDGVPVRIGRILRVAVPRLPLGRVATASERIETTAAAQWVDRLLGAGDGLTPYGDDVLCGWLALHRAAGVATPAVDAAVRAGLHRTTLLSATLLDCAGHGEVLPEFAAWVAALGTAAEPAAAAALVAVGHSSGRGLLAGGRRALAGLSAAAVAA